MLLFNKITRIAHLMIIDVIIILHRYNYHPDKRYDYNKNARCLSPSRRSRVELFVIDVSMPPKLQDQRQ
jgi:hypothetical protein